MALRSSSARAELFTGIHKIRRFAPEEVRRALRGVLSSTYPPQITSDWRDSIAESGHPVLKKVLRYIPGDSDQNNKKAMKGEDPDRKFGLYEPDVGSLSVFPRQVNEHGKSKVDPGLELQPEEKENFHKLSELDLLTLHYLEDSLPDQIYGNGLVSLFTSACCICLAQSLVRCLNLEKTACARQHHLASDCACLILPVQAVLKASTRQALADAGCCSCSTSYSWKRCWRITPDEKSLVVEPGASATVFLAGTSSAAVSAAVFSDNLVVVVRKNQ
ncbi:RNA-binding (RRM/RBD/RNP motifs) family protein [Striga asiatica]|uniref:RNA-binding (RRM/RBD/RNP motifs) family protein n=1 Tax=Striga asiatica TaxID=4170 RepID=A0A5A7QWY7_STRAF|nr:RNA-binding (RRM/RBD/RNP motifs) family protein [Striga asiatica]